MKNLVFMLISLLVLAAIVPGCSGNKSASNLRIITEEFPPFNFSGPDKSISGQSSEVVREIVKRTQRIHSKVTFEIRPWSQGYELAQKESNVILYSTARIPEREKLFKWAGPIGSEDNYFYVRQDSGLKISSLDEARQVRSIAVYQNDSNQLYLSSHGFSNLDINQNDAQCLKKLVEGKVDVWLGPARALPYIAKAAQVKAADVKALMLVRNLEWYIAFNQSIPDSTVKNWQTTLDEMKKADSSGVSPFDRIIQSYTSPQ